MRMATAFYKSLSCLVLLFAMPLIPASGQVNPGATHHQTLQPGVTNLITDGHGSLPRDAQYGISAAVGRHSSIYHAKRLRKGFELVSPKQRLAVVFQTSGIEVRDGNNVWSLSPPEFGYGSHLRVVDEALVNAHAN